jgi:hypothetical protein
MRLAAQLKPARATLREGFLAVQGQLWAKQSDLIDREYHK